MKIAGVFLVVAALAAGSVSRAADITGVITFKGTPPPEYTNNLIMDDDYCGQFYSTPPTTHFYVVGPNGGLADVVVSLKDADGKDIIGKSTGPSQPSALLDQKACQYVPQILAIQTGQKLIVRNSDQCVHNVHTISTAGNPEHNDAQMPGGPDLVYTFPKPEMFMTFKCDIHQWMFAWVSIFDNPYFSISDEEGKFVIKDVPPGKYTVVADHRKLGEQTQTVEVGDTDVTVNFTFELKK
ncbi:MAG TPA: carboxypeptidase regulatory-like domain-containing protein [Candidatus Aquilonibacter sp.]|nr:carboxypeptidase regulatory-like domain-containing protein [Candidatus Aquilonibacter sp.]